PHLGLLSTDRGDRIRSRHPREDHRRDAGGHDLRTPGARHRPRPLRLDGEEEAGGLLLMNDATMPLDARADVAAYLQQHETKSLLRVITCGSVADGKSTQIGRQLHDTKLLLDDQVAALESHSKRHGPQNGEIDFALLVDGLAEERDQGIT